jgi:hypothetical protein
MAALAEHMGVREERRTTLRLHDFMYRFMGMARLHLHGVGVVSGMTRLSISSGRGFGKLEYGGISRVSERITRTTTNTYARLFIESLPCSCDCSLVDERQVATFFVVQKEGSGTMFCDWLARDLTLDVTAKYIINAESPHGLLLVVSSTLNHAPSCTSPLNDLIEDNPNAFAGRPSSIEQISNLHRFITLAL